MSRLFPCMSRLATRATDRRAVSGSAPDGRYKVIKKLVPLLMALAFVASAAAPVAAARRQVSGSFTASAKPLPAMWFAPGVNGCDKGVEAVHKVTHPIVAPFSGWLSVEMRFEGEWDLTLVDESGQWLAASSYQAWTHEEAERLQYFLDKGDEVAIVACNWASASDAEVRYSLREGPAWPSETRQKVSRLEELSYSSPALATTHNFVICHHGYDLGCTATSPLATDRFVEIEVVDDVSPTVSFELYQYHGSTYLREHRFCGSTGKRVPLSPRADFVGVTVYIGPCSDGTPAMGTTGKVLMRFSSR